MSYLRAPLESMLHQGNDSVQSNNLNATSADVKFKSKKLGVILFDDNAIAKMDIVVGKIADYISSLMPNDDTDEERKSNETRMIVDSTPVAGLTPIREARQSQERCSIHHIDETVCRI